MDPSTIPHLIFKWLRWRRDSLLSFELIKFWQEDSAGSRARLGCTGDRHGSAAQTWQVRAVGFISVERGSDANLAAGTVCCTKAERSWTARNGSSEVIFACEGELL